MCTRPDDDNPPLCDECLEKFQDGADFDTLKLCDTCRAIMSRTCCICGITFRTAEDASIESNACKYCRAGIPPEETALRAEFDFAEAPQ